MASDGSTSSITAQEQAPLQTEQPTTQLEALKSKTEKLELELKIERLAINKATDYAEEVYAEMNKWADSSDRFGDEVKRLEEVVKELRKDISRLETELQLRKEISRLETELQEVKKTGSTPVIR
jgi:uncharacterized coiled-coil DUF342 family protein